MHIGDHLLKEDCEVLLQLTNPRPNNNTNNNANCETDPVCSAYGVCT